MHVRRLVAVASVILLAGCPQVSDNESEFGSGTTGNDTTGALETDTDTATDTATASDTATATETDTVGGGADPTDVLAAQPEVATGCGHDGQLCGEGKACDGGICKDAPAGWAKRVVAGTDFSCGIKSSSAAYCWGSNAFGQLGIGNSAKGPYSKPLKLQTLDIKLLWAGHRHACFSKFGKSGLSCFGDNSDGATAWSSTGLKKPNTVVGLSNVLVAATGHGFSCAITKDGTKDEQLYCWGDGTKGKLGYGESVGGPKLRHVKTMYKPAVIGLGKHHACARGQNGVFCWGDNEHGQLGDGNGGLGIESVKPVSIQSLKGGAQLALGDAHSCVLLSGASVLCWGDNTHGQLGSNAKPPHTQTPNKVVGASVAGIDTIVQVCAGARHTCVRGKNGAVRCFGDNSHGQLGVNGLTKVANTKSLACGAEHNCVFDKAGRVWCWGNNAHMQLGHKTPAKSSVPLLVPAP